VSLQHLSLLTIPAGTGQFVRAAWTAPCCEALHCLVWRVRDDAAAQELIAFLQEAASDPATVHVGDLAARTEGWFATKPLYVGDEPCESCARELGSSLDLRVRRAS
jgi:hypothetical protein